MITDITKRALIVEYQRRVHEFTYDELVTDINLIPTTVKLLRKLYRRKISKTQMLSLFNNLRSLLNIFGSLGIVALIEYISEDFQELETTLSTVLVYTNLFRVENTQIDNQLLDTLSAFAIK